MKTTSFDARIIFSHPVRGGIIDATVVFGGKKVLSLFSVYEDKDSSGGEQRFIHVKMNQAEDLRWGDAFEVFGLPDQKSLGQGTVLFPSAKKSAGGKKGTEKRLELLFCLAGNESEMLAALAREKGIRGIGEGEVLDLTPLSGQVLVELCQKLEAEGQIKIVSFSPLFLLSQSGFEFLCQKILAFLQRFHETHPDERGVRAEALKKKFDLPSRIYSLALGHLVREEEIMEAEGYLASAGFHVTLKPEEEVLLDKIEALYLDEKLHSVSIEELRQRFQLSAKRLENLLSLLTEKRKIVKGKDGFILHSQWLDELASKLRTSGKTELTVGEFKQMTGLSRKYAIPLLELLDQMGVTRRRGPTREILK